MLKDKDGNVINFDEEQVPPEFEDNTAETDS